MPTKVGNNLYDSVLESLRGADRRQELRNNITRVGHDHKRFKIRQSRSYRDKKTLPDSNDFCMDCRFRINTLREMKQEGTLLVSKDTSNKTVVFQLCSSQFLSLGPMFLNLTWSVDFDRVVHFLRCYSIL